ncbi:plasmid mobilization relaxosome protein MobC [Arcanobacterium ihumii]|uniref:plasmid mobilization relaxosome protein MobC n=1 Tax=Arcanobacterium ihumii TaxID=2138162 RepID=UPI0038995725
MRLCEQRNFSKFAREILTTGIVTVSNSASIADEISRQLGPIGNNINQIARKANTDNLLHSKRLMRLWSCWRKSIILCKS